MMGGIVRGRRKGSRRGSPLAALAGLFVGIGLGPILLVLIVVLVGLVLAARELLLYGLSGPEPPEPPNVLLITVDTLRADHLGAWGDTRVDTPAIDAFLAEALVFENAFATAPLTTPSLGSILTSLMPRNHGALNNAYDLEVRLSFTSDLRRHGLATAAFLPTFLAEKEGFKRGFDVYEHPAPGAPPFSGEELVRRATAFMDEHESRPWFVWIHLLEPHSPYDPGPELERKALAAAGLAGVEVPARLRRETYGEADELTARDLAIVRALYRGEVERTDRALAPLLERVRASTRPTWTVFTADHGEELHDARSYVGHAAWLDDAMLRVPLAFHSTDGAFPAGRRCDPASLLDVAPTLLGALGLGFETGGGGLDLSHGEAPADRLLVHETFAPESFRDKVAARRGARKLVRVDGGDAWVVALDRDPLELAPVADEEALTAELDAWISHQTDPASHRRPALDAETIRALEAMGYAQSGDGR